MNQYKNNLNNEEQLPDQITKRKKNKTHFTILNSNQNLKLDIRCKSKFNNQSNPPKITILIKEAKCFGSAERERQNV